MGHFVVLLPGGGWSTHRVWEPGIGEQGWPTDVLAERMSGAALLVSPDPIDDPQLLLNSSGRWLIYTAVSQAAFLVGLLLLGLFHRRASVAVSV